MSFVEGYFPNEDEILGLTGQKTMDDALKVALSFGPRLIVVKLGSRGCRVKTRDEDFTVEGYVVQAISTVGAGDAFNAGFITQYLQEKPIDQCAVFANATASFLVSRNYQPKTQEVLNFIDKSA